MNQSQNDLLVEIDEKFQDKPEEVDKQSDKSEDIDERPEQYFLGCWPEVTEAIKKVGAKTIEMDLHYDEESVFMNAKNRPKFLTTATPEQIFVGFNRDAKTPFMFVRYIDEIHNKKQNIDACATSFIVVILAHIPHVGFEPMMYDYKWEMDPETKQVRCTGNPTMPFDGGRWIGNHIKELIEGTLEGKKIR